MNFIKTTKVAHPMLTAVWEKIKNTFRVRKFNHPDVWLAAVSVGDIRVYARIKKDCALLERVPTPESGYHFKDVVRIRGPVGKSYFRDEEIMVYEALEVVIPSHIQSFRFTAIVPTPGDYFALVDCFRGATTHVEFPYSTKEFDPEWRMGFCAARNMQEAKANLDKFTAANDQRKVKDLRCIAS
ncbi:MAG: hypothetical protein WCW40_02490 [Bacteroidota bacterium]